MQPEEPLHTESWPIDRPKPYDKNPRVIPQSAIDKVAASIKEFGWRQPIVVDKHDVIVLGHTRLRAAFQLAQTHVPVHVAGDLTPAQIKALRIADNRTNQESEWEPALLGIELAELQGFDFDLALTGFDPAELTTYLHPEVDPASGLTDEDSIPEPPARPVTLAGDLWLLGTTHRLLCGDSTKKDDVNRLMGEDKADLVVTDPPYNVDYEGYTAEGLKIQNDKMPPAEFDAFLRAAFANYLTVLKPEGSMYVCHASSVQRQFENQLELAGFTVRCQIIWAKNTFAWGFGRYKFQHEPIFYCHVTDQKDPWYGDKSQSTLWEEKKPAANRLHPTMKPVEIIERALVNSSKTGDLVLDLFGGSGSTLIGCVRRERNCYLMELDPRYCDVILQRYADFTGLQPTHQDGGTFEEVKLKRAA